MSEATLEDVFEAIRREQRELKCLLKAESGALHSRAVQELAVSERVLSELAQGSAPHARQARFAAPEKWLRATIEDSRRLADRLSTLVEDHRMLVALHQEATKLCWKER